MISKKLFSQIYKIHIKQIKNLSIPHKKMLICFSGIAGSGKTYIAKILEEKYKGVRLRADDIREIVSKLKLGDLDQITYSYLNWFRENYFFKNKLIILDQGIDRHWQDIFSFFKKKKYKIFIIRLKVSEKVYEKRIIKKLGKLDNNYLNRINDWERQYKEFGEKVKPGIIIENEDRLNLKPLFLKLDKLI